MGIGASSLDARRRSLFCAVLAVALALAIVVLASSALGAGNDKLQFYPELRYETIHATRAHIEIAIDTNDKNYEWSGEYAQEEDGHAPPAGSPAWIPAGHGTAAEEGSNIIALGTNDASGHSFNARILHHLTPATTYYARFHVKDATENVESPIFEFTTTAVAAPEVASQYYEVGLPLTTFTMVPSSLTAASANFTAQIETNGAATEYHFEYAEASGGPWRPFASGAGGTVTVAEDYANPVARLSGLKPETVYYVRVAASNDKGIVRRETFSLSDEEIDSFTTVTARPVAGILEAHNVTGESARLIGGIAPHGLETHWRFEYATSALGPWADVPGGAGTISKSEAEATPEEFEVQNEPETELTHLGLAEHYYFRLFAESEAGEGRNGYSEPISMATRGLGSFETAAGLPTASTFTAHALHGESLRVLGAVDPNNAPATEEQTIAVEGAPTGGTFTLTFDGQTTAPIAFDAPAWGAGSVESALNALAAIGGGLTVRGPVGGPYRVYFVGTEERPLGGKAQPLIAVNSSGLTPSGAVTVAVAQQGGVGYDADYHFEYVSQKKFGQAGSRGGFAEASSTPTVAGGPGEAPRIAGIDLPSLQSGETYDFRIVVASDAPGNPVVYGQTQTFVIPAPAPVEGQASCPNAMLRRGPSAGLPDCRAYEQVTPVEKEGTQELFTFRNTLTSGVLIGEDGDHVAVNDPAISWGGPGAGRGPYFLSRNPQTGWQLTSGAPSAETGAAEVFPQLFTPDLGEFAFESAVHTSLGSGESKDIELRAGPPNGPYRTVASVARTSGEVGGLVAGSADLSKVVLETEDRKLLGRATGTEQGGDLYEYSGGELRQVNVSSQGRKLGTCGAHVVRGYEEAGLNGDGAGQGVQATSTHAVSADGARVFFEAVPGGDCSEPANLYMREGAAGRTVDIGAYRFAGANPQDSRLLLEKKSGESYEFFLYEEGEPAIVKPLFTTHELVREPVVSREFTDFYFAVDEGLPGTEGPAASPETGGYPLDIYRYDLAGQSLHFLVQVGYLSADASPPEVSPDGRYYYFDADRVAGVPGGSEDALPAPPGSSDDNQSQVYRYDSAENALECISCASPFDPAPKLGAYRENATSIYDKNGMPKVFNTITANGDFAFFDTPAALVPEDVDGEVVPEGVNATAENKSAVYSVSSDVYEWRREGVDGCAHMQGCVALISSGRGGTLNILLGTAAEGRDVFFYTLESLRPADNDTAGDIYDARIDGGFPEASRPVECEGDACSAPLAAPVDLTPASATFQGTGDVFGEVRPPGSKPKSSKVKPKKKKKHKTRRRAVPRKADRRGSAKRAARVHDGGVK